LKVISFIYSFASFPSTAGQSRAVNSDMPGPI
jgi:hypothetical protein